MSRLARMHRRPRWLPAAVPLALTALAAAAAPSVHAQAADVDVFGTFLQSGGFFDYNFSVLNRGTPTLLFVDIFVATGEPPAATNLSAPAGFRTVFDSGLGLVSFLPSNPLTNGEFTTGRTVSGFTFRSATLLTGRTFTATDENLTTVTAPIRLTNAAPEPGTLGFVALTGAPFAAAVFSRRRRRLAVSRSLKG